MNGEYRRATDEEKEDAPEHSSAPEWVIDMIRTGKPVRCKVWNGKEWTGDETFIDGYIVGSQYPYRGASRWEHAEPIPAWKPQNDEAVLTCVVGRAELGYVKGGFVLVRGNTIPLEQAEVIPLDVDKIGKLWVEIS